MGLAVGGKDMAATLERAKIKPAPESVSREAAVFRAMELLGDGACMRIGGVSWDDYLAFDAWRDKLRPKLKLAYSDGELEFMTTSYDHDSESRALGFALAAIARVFGTLCKPAGSMTIRKKLKKKGIEPDECYYLSTPSPARGTGVLNLKVHSVPDLAIEVDRANSSLPKLPIYAALGIPELWRLEGNSWVFYVLQKDGVYAKAKASKSFPKVKSLDFSRFFFSADWNDVNNLMDATRDWAAKL
jgi:Uma2 family endonuclease